MWAKQVGWIVGFLFLAIGMAYPMQVPHMVK